MFKDIVLEEIYGKLISNLRSRAYIQGINQGVRNTVEIIDEMTKQGIVVTRQSIIEYSVKRIEEDQIDAEEPLMGVLDKFLSERTNKKQELDDEPADQPAEPASEQSATVVNLFPNKKEKL